MIKRLLPAMAAAAMGTSALAAETPPQLRVCSDPNNLPFSNAKGEGFENKIAEILAEELKAELHYTWHPQRRGFVRKTLNAGTCNLIIGVPAEYDLAVPSKPYYRSTYVFVSRKDRNLGLTSFDDPRLGKLKIGLHALGDDGANTPPAHSLANRGFVNNVVGFRMWDNDQTINPQGEIIEAVAKGSIDVAIVWGPLAGYFAKQQHVPLDITPVPTDIAALPVTYDISFGVRRGNELFKQRLEAVAQKRQKDIRAILEQYGVPLANAPVFAAKPTRGTD